MAQVCRSLGLKDKLVLLGLFIGVFSALILSFILPLFITVIVVNFFLLFVLVLFLVLYFSDKEQGRAKYLKNYPSCSVLIASYNSKRTIVECINSVKAMNYPRKFEIIVVNDGSTDGSDLMLKKMKGIKLINLKKNSGKAVALNTGLKSIKSEFVACIDSDTYPKDDVLLKTLGYFEDKKVGAVTCLVLPDKRQSLIQRIQFIEYAAGFGLWTTLLSSINSMTMIPGPMTVFKMEFFKRAGGYEDGNLTEDMEIGLRLQKYGYKIKTCFEAIAYTDIPDTLGKLFKQRDRWYRGRVFNLMGYKELFFSKNNYDLGFFSLPYLFALELVSVVMLFKLSILFLENAFKFVLIQSGVVALTNSVILVLNEIILPSSMVFFVTSYALVLLFLFVSMRLIHYQPRGMDYLAILIYLLFYPLFITVIYFQSFVKEMLGVRGSWVRVSI